MLQPDYLRSMTINGLLKDYAAVAQSLKRLRDLPSPTETDRVQATEWFNRVFVLYASALLSVDDLPLVTSRRAAQLWVELVAPLDRVVREVANGPDDEGYVNPVEEFWRDYAAGQLRVFAR